MARVQKRGNGLGIRIPKPIAEKAKLVAGTIVRFETAGGVLTIRAVRQPRYTLAGLLSQAKGANPHRSIWTDGPIGREII